MTTRFTRGQSCIVRHTRFSICYSAQSKHKTQFIIIAHQSNIAFESLHKTSSVGKVALFHVGAHNSTNYLCKLLQTIVTRVCYSLAELLSVSGGKLLISISTQPANMLVVFRLQTNWWNQPYLHDCTQAIGFVFAFFCSVGNNVLLTQYKIVEYWSNVSERPFFASIKTTLTPPYYPVPTSRHCTGRNIHVDVTVSPTGKNIQLAMAEAA